jgi:hypothetical protein
MLVQCARDLLDLLRAGFLWTQIAKDLREARDSTLRDDLDAHYEST